MKNKNRDLIDQAKTAADEMSEMLERDDFIDPADIRSAADRYGQLYADLHRRTSGFLSRIGLADRELKEQSDRFRSIYEGFPQHLKQHDDDLARRKAADIGQIINPVEGYDLDEQQLTAIAYDVRSRLVIAGAGTGKTTDIVGFVKYLLKSGKASPDEILALSFTNSSVSDLRKRIVAETGSRVEVSTFHRLGIKIIACSENKVPKVSHIKIGDFISEEIKKRRSDSRFVRSLSEFLAYDFDMHDEDQFGNCSELEEYLHKNPLITLNGERVKSFGEADIANYLAINGVPYTYEDSYCVDTADSEYGQYHPDFHINGTRIYIEYFGIDRSGGVAKFMVDENPDAREDYLRGIEWKKQIHRANGTTLIELYAYERSEGSLLDKLGSELKRLGIESSPEPPEAVFDRTFGSDSRALRAVSSLLTTAILLIKGFGESWDRVFFDNVLPKVRNIKDRQSLRRTEAVLRPLYDAYRAALDGNGEIDFEDMLNNAAECIRRGKYTHPYRYVIVDEYQDLSRSRYNLLKAMRDSRDFSLFCVGDDWQSIYRFNGCDISYILDFEKYWGPSAVCRIERTYRFSGEILEKSSLFISRNPRQYPKKLIGMSKTDGKVYYILGADSRQICSEIGKKLAYMPAGKKVLFLGRYNHDVSLLSGDGFDWRPDISDGSDAVTYSCRPDLKMKYMTIHSSKGLQADVVFSLNNNSGRYGFPSMRQEPALIGLLLDGGGSQMDEERRLFYVAMTRAREAVYIVSAKDHQSVFFTEMFPRRGPGGYAVRMFCPICGGPLVLRTNSFGGRFYGCSNFGPKGCRYTRECGTGNSDHRTG